MDRNKDHCIDAMRYGAYAMLNTNKKRKRKQKLKKIALILVIIGVAMIVIGSILLLVENNQLKRQLVEIETDNRSLSELNSQLFSDNAELRFQNEALWEVYYINVSDYEGEYEYYE
jgi:beta-lactamase regulating signal transducer with metallopeptidase domain